ncbi:SDR family oxidoreductase [Haloechinothrix salitolerans]|uniref:SDR family oxidoreductase n=1 Tax=Haloechinothrix salitolerans TaxID=926830 RepID=A0ABW2BTR8_9PSEU
MSTPRRRALVTASSRGIGNAIAKRLRNSGMDVYVTGRGQEKTERAAAEIGAAGWCTADLTEAGAAEYVTAAANEVLGGIDVLVCNTGGPRAGTFDSLTADDWEYSYRLILDSAIRLTREVVGAMRFSGWGRLIYLTSCGSVRPLPELHLSNVMRSGVESLAMSIAAEVAPDGVTTHVVAPAHIDTARRKQITRHLAEKRGVDLETFEKEQLTKVPMGRFGQPQEVAALVDFLCSEDAGFLTGRTHVIDGGFTQVVPL